MKEITIRDVEPILSKKLKEAVKEKEYTVLQHDLDHLFGRWTEKEFNQIQRKIDRERKIDKEI
ncbi:MAG: hypothetical protein KAQ69_12595, partial [Spirochaetales bacterium]|nr:hypothetical protein [Spirochaetales bacterium]